MATSRICSVCSHTSFFPRVIAEPAGGPTAAGRFQGGEPDLAVLSLTRFFN